MITSHKSGFRESGTSLTLWTLGRRRGDAVEPRASLRQKLIRLLHGPAVHGDQRLPANTVGPSTNSKTHQGARNLDPRRD